MYMRGKLLFATLLAAVMSLSSCVKSIECPADELKMYRWSGVSENGAETALYFRNTSGYLDIENGGESLHIGGFCMATDNYLLIFDEQSGMNYSFGYQLHGDRVELKRDSCTLTLEKDSSE